MMFAAADGNANGIVDAADYIVWRSNLGTSLSADGGSALPSAEPLSAAVPEPSTVILMILAAVGWCFAGAGPHRKSPKTHQHVRHVNNPPIFTQLMVTIMDVVQVCLDVEANPLVSWGVCYVPRQSR